jgi:hypothetical protein
MGTIRNIKRISKSVPTIEGAGVHLKRAFGNNEAPQLDPFLLLDDFHSDNPDDYIQGFPWHPHRGIETITYVLHGDVEHGDSMGNKGDISSGDVQWMTAGSGIIHQEMPKGTKDGLMWGFQLWANLPASQKMIEPKYRDVTKDIIPEVILDSGAKVKIIAGEVNSTKGPVRDIVIDPEYLDITVPPDTSFSHDTKKGHTVFAYVVDGSGYFDPEKDKLLEKENLIIYENGDSVHITSSDEPVRFLLISGKPLKEPVAWYGPIVMNTQEELEKAFEEYRKGSFIK